MKGRTIHKHIAQWQIPFRKGIWHYNAKIHNCKRWRNRRKAQKLADHWWHDYMKGRLH